MPENHLEIIDYEFFADGLQLSILCGLAPKFPIPEPRSKANNFHTHFWYELFYVNQDSIIFHVKDRDIEVTAGNMLLVNPDHVHYVTNNSCVPVVAFSVKPTSEKFCRHPILETLRFTSSRIFETDKKCDMLMELLLDAHERSAPKEAGNFMFGLLLYISGLSPNSTLEIQHDSEASRIFKIEHLLNLYATKKHGPSLEDIAYELNISARQLSRIIKKSYGCSFTEKIAEIRMLKATGLLQMGKTVTEAASEVGYSSVRAFYAAFYEKYGVTPGEYRKEKHKEK